MPTVTVSNDVNQAALNAALAIVNGGSIALTTAADAILASLPLSPTAFQNATVQGVAPSQYAQAASNQIGNSGTPSPGTIGKLKLRDGSGNVKITFDVGLSGSNAAVIVSDVVIPVDTDYVAMPSGFVVTARAVAA